MAAAVVTLVVEMVRGDTNFMYGISLLFFLAFYLIYCVALYFYFTLARRLYVSCLVFLFLATS